MSIDRTPNGVRFGLLSANPSVLQPLFLYFTTDIEHSLSDPLYAVLAKALASQGVLIASIDLPSHGANDHTRKVPSLSQWANLARRGEDIFSAFDNQVRDVIDHLLATRQADPRHIAAGGISRGAFAALHCAATDQRIRSVAGISPVTNLSALSEFRGISDAKNIVAPAALAFTNLWMTIGRDDRRVGTENVMKFMRDARVSAEPRVIRELVKTDQSGHNCSPENLTAAAQWVTVRLKDRSTNSGIAVSKMSQTTA